MLTPVLTAAQTQTVEMADGMRAEGKIYVVVAVLATILAGLLLYVHALDRRITRMEREEK
jgi:uncharacterized integral membrane protein